MFEILWRLWKMFKQHRALTSDIADDRCVACDSADLTALGPGAYRCNSCGYEGGSGLATMHEQAQRSAWAAWSPEKRRASALSGLEDARRFLISADGCSSGAMGASSLDMVGLSASGSDVRSDTQTELVAAMGDMEIARKHIRDALHKLEREASSIQAPGHGTVTWELEHLLDSPLTDLFVLGRIHKTWEQIHALMRVVDMLVAELDE